MASPNITLDPQYASEIHSQINLLLFIYEGNQQTMWQINLS